MSRNNIQYRRVTAGGPELVLSREEPRAYPWHFHARHRTFGLVREGFAVLTTLQGTAPLAKGESFVIPPLAPHKLSLGPQSSLAVLCIPETAVETNRGIRDLVWRDEDEDMALWLAQPGSAPTVTAHCPDARGAAPVAAARDLLAAQPHGHFPLEALAEFAGYSPWHFLRAFKKHTGLTPHAFQLICRVSRARVLLRSGTAAAETAVSSGFADQSHLHKVFKLHHGLTPKQFTGASVAPCC